MSVYIGLNELQNAYAGTSEVSSIYVDTEEAWSASNGPVEIWSLQLWKTVAMQLDVMYPAKFKVQGSNIKYKGILAKKQSFIIEVYYIVDNIESSEVLAYRNTSQWQNNKYSILKFYKHPNEELKDILDASIGVDIQFVSETSFTIETSNNTKNWDGSILCNSSTWDGTTTLTSVLENGVYVLRFRGSGNTKITGAVNGANWSITGNNVSCNGDIIKLLGMNIGEYAFYRLFWADVDLVKAPTIKNVGTNVGAYKEMFRMTSITEVPTLPSTALYAEVFKGMFSGCEYIKTPKLPIIATDTIPNSAMEEMYNTCLKLRVLPEIKFNLEKYKHTISNSISDSFLHTINGTFSYNQGNGNYSISITDDNRFPKDTFNLRLWLTSNGYTIYTNPYPASGTYHSYYGEEMPVSGVYYDTTNNCFGFMSGTGTLHPSTILTTTDTVAVSPTASKAGTVNVSLYSNDNATLNWNGLCAWLDTNGHTSYENRYSASGTIAISGTTYSINSLYLDSSETRWIYVYYGNDLSTVILPKYSYSFTDTVTVREITLGNYAMSYMFENCLKIKLSQTQTAEYPYPYRIPKDLNTVKPEGTDALEGMFEHTGGTFRATPSSETTYYTNNQPV